MSTPDQTQKRIAIAEFMGWKINQPWGDGYFNDSPSVPAIRYYHDAIEPDPCRGFPDFFTDLNACREAALALMAKNPTLYHAYSEHLEIIFEREEQSSMGIQEASAEQRAEAIFRVISK